MTDMPTCTVTVDDIYGNGWWEKNQELVLEKWRVDFRQGQSSEKCVTVVVSEAHVWMPSPQPLLIILGPARPTLMEVYSSESVTIPEGHEWTGIFSHIKNPGDDWLSILGDVCFDDRTDIGSTQPRLILRRTEPRVWFKAEDGRRCPKQGEWNWDEGTHSWRQALCDFNIPMLCATRHEEPTPAYTLTEEEVAKRWA